MHFSGGTSPLGTFSHLPSELRVLIWKELLPEGRPPPNSDPRRRCLGILATSRHLYHEIRQELYKNRTITFHISPHHGRTLNEPYNEKSTIAISDQLGSIWSLYPRFNMARAEQAPETLFWERLPFRKLKGVNFELTAPDPTNPAELPQMWNKVCWLMDLLQYARSLPPVEVYILEVRERKWCANGELNHSIDEPPLQLGQKSSDLEILFSCFRRLRKVKHIQVKLPSDGRTSGSMPSCQRCR